MERWQFGRFVNRVGQMLSYVPEEKESNLLTLLRASLHRGNPNSDPRAALAAEINKLYLFLGPAKTNLLMTHCQLCQVVIDEKMTKESADRLWAHLKSVYDDWYDQGISV